MSSIDVEALLQPVSAEKPEGEDLEYAPEYLELDRVSQGKPEEEIGNVKKPAEDPDWKEMRRLAGELATRARDLRVAVHLVTGLLMTEGFAGMAAGMAVLQGTVEKYWETCYPKLDPDDNNDPTMRLNCLAMLGPTGALRQRVREAPLTNSRQIGRFSLRHMLMATGQEAPPPAADGQPAPPDSAVIEAAFKDTSPEELQATSQGLQDVIAHLTAIDKLLAEKVGGGRGPSFRELLVVLQDIQKHLGTALAKIGLGAVPADGQAVSGSDNAPVGPAARGAGAPISGEIASREDAIRMMDKIVVYFEAYEPSSPVPLLIKRARRLVSLNFMDLIKDLTPDAIARLEMISGTEAAPPSNG